MADWMKSKSSVRNSYESSSHSRWSTQSNCSTTVGERKDSKDVRNKFEENFWSVLNELNASVTKTHAKGKKILKLVEKYCRFRSHVSTSSHGPNATSSFSAAKSHSTTKPSQSASKPSSASKSWTFPKPLDKTKPSNGAHSFSMPKLPNLHKATKSSSVNNSLAVVKSKPHSNTPKKVTAKRSDETELKYELHRLAASEGFVTKFPQRYKRIPKPVERFSISLYDEQRARRSNRRQSGERSKSVDRRKSGDRCKSGDHRKSSDRRKSFGGRESSEHRQNNETDLADETPNKKKKEAEKEAVFEVQQQKTVSETTSTTVSKLTGAGTTQTKIVTSTKKTAVHNFNYKGTIYISHSPMIEVKAEKVEKAD